MLLDAGIRAAMGGLMVVAAMGPGEETVFYGRVVDAGDERRSTAERAFF